MPSFRLICIAASILSLTLATALIVYPALIYLIFSMEGSSGADIISRRAGMLFIGLGVVCWRLRNVEGEARTGLATGMTAAMVGLAVVGGFEFYRGAVGPGIFLAMTAETALAALFLRHARG